MGTNLLPLFTDSHLDWAAELLDKVTLKKGFADMVDKPVYRLALGMLNRYVSPEIPDEFKADFNDAMDLVVEGDYDDAGAEAIDMVSVLVMKLKNEAAKEVILGMLSIIKGTLKDLD